MKKTIYRVAIFACIAIVSAIVFYGCKHEALSLNKSNSEKGSIASIKEQFTSLKYDAFLTTKINDTASVYLEPKWDYTTTKRVGDSIVYTYILLHPAVKINNKIDSRRRVLYNYVRQYLLVREQKNQKISFSIARYFLDPKIANSLNKTNSLSPTALTTSFTGKLFVNDLTNNS